MVWITWPCRLCELPHTVDLLGEVAAIDEGHTHQDHTFNVALLDAQSWRGTQHETVAATLATEIPTVTLDSPGFRPLRDVDGSD